MRTRRVRGAVTVACGILLASVAAWTTERQAGDDGLAAFRADLERLARDGSWWWASNEGKESRPDAPDAYGVRYWIEPGGVSASGCLWSIAGGAVAAVHWRFFQAWDAAEGKPFFYQSHTSGTLTGMGYLTSRDGLESVIEQRFVGPDGNLGRIRHRSTWPGEDTHVTESASWSDGEWTPQRSDTWERRTTDAAPCGPVR